MQKQEIRLQLNLVLRSTGSFPLFHEMRGDDMSAGEAFDRACPALLPVEVPRMETALVEGCNAVEDGQQNASEDECVSTENTSTAHALADIEGLGALAMPNNDDEVRGCDVGRTTLSGDPQDPADHPSPVDARSGPGNQTESDAPEVLPLQTAGDERSSGDRQQARDTRSAFRPVPLPPPARQPERAAWLASDGADRFGTEWRASLGLTNMVGEGDEASPRGIVSTSVAPEQHVDDIAPSRLTWVTAPADLDRPGGHEGATCPADFPFSRARVADGGDIVATTAAGEKRDPLIASGNLTVPASEMPVQPPQLPSREIPSFGSHVASVQPEFPPSVGRLAAAEGVSHLLPRQPPQATHEDDGADAAHALSGPNRVTPDGSPLDLGVFAAAVEMPGGTEATDPGVARPVARMPVPIHRQLADVIVTSRDGLTEVTLSPEELGRVRVVISRDDHLTRVGIVAERPETLDLVRRHADLLVRELRDSGAGEPDISFAAWDGRGQQGQNRGGAGNALPVPETDLQDAKPQQDQPIRTAGRAAAASAGEKRIDIRI